MLTAVQALPAVILKDPAVKSALLAVQAFAGSVQGAEAQAVKAIESIPVVKQLQAELSVLAKVLQPYAQAVSAKMNVEALVKQLPLPMQVVEKEMVKWHRVWRRSSTSFRATATKISSTAILSTPKRSW